MEYALRLFVKVLLSPHLYTRFWPLFITPVLVAGGFALYYHSWSPLVYAAVAIPLFAVVAVYNILRGAW